MPSCRACALGGRHGPAGVAPLAGDFEVLRLGNGRFTATGPMYGGNRMDLGPMALLRSLRGAGRRGRGRRRGGCRRPTGRSCIIWASIPPTRRILALKSSVHFRADFEPWRDEVLIVAAPGANTADPAAAAASARLPAGCGGGPGSIARYTAGSPLEPVRSCARTVALSSPIVKVTR